MPPPEKPIEWPKLFYKDVDGKTCPVLMRGDDRCGRKLHTHKHAEDDHHVCLMHTRDPGKDNAAFQEEFERILADAGEGVADFTGFVFPESNYSGRGFRAKCWFWRATFTQKASFYRAMFTQAASFFQANFMQAAYFFHATFTEDADFRGATFTEDADFRWATFTEDANFRGATFTQKASFYRATFSQAANFLVATFTQDAEFIRATFSQVARFSAATFKQAADFRWATLHDGAEFRETTFREDGSNQPGPIFCETRIEKPERILFYKTCLGQALFHNCDVSKVNFSAVRWGRRGRNAQTGKRRAFEEVVALEHDAAAALQPVKGDPNERNYELISELYQQLKKNYDDRRDYWTAGDFHYGELEMKRLHSARHWRLARWWHRRMGLYAWYKYVSDYGESYAKASGWLLFFLAAFVFLYPAIGLEDASQAPGNPVLLTYASPVAPPVEDPSDLWWARLRLVGKSLVTTLQVAIFQRDIMYPPAGTLGGFLRSVQVLMLSTLFALVLLAVRRQVRR